MTTVKQPDVTFQVVAGRTTVSLAERKILVVGQMLAGSATAGQLQTNIQNDNSWDTLFGERSMIAAMIRAVRSVNTETQVDAIGIADNGSGVDATGTITIGGTTATAAGSYNVYVGSRRKHKFTISVAATDTVAQVATAIAAAITADDRVPVTAAAVAGVITLTAAHAGTLGNVIGIEIEGTVAGLTTATTAMTGGATDPVLTSVLDVVGDERYQDIIWPWASDISTVKDFVDARFNVNNDVLSGTAWIPSLDTHANLLTTANLHNSPSTTIIGDEIQSEDLYKAPAIFETEWVKASLVGALHALRLTDGAAIGSIVIARDGGLDAIGGPALASKPLFNTPIAGLTVPRAGRGFTRQEIEQLTTAGVTVIGKNRAGNQVILGEVVTTYKTDTAGNPDQSFKFQNYRDTITSIREFFDASTRVDFAQARLTPGDVVPGHDFVNELFIRAKFKEYYTTVSGAGYALSVAGDRALQFFDDNLTLSIDFSTGTVTADMIVPVVVQTRTINAVMRIGFTIGGNG